MKIYFSKIIAVIFLGLMLVACKTSYNPTQEAPGFLPDYSVLKPVASPPEGTEIYTYKASDFQRSDYQGVIVNPVVLYQQPTKKGVTQPQIENARNELQNGIIKIVSRKIAIVNTPGPGVAKLDVAITGAMLENDSLKLRNLIPISAAITIASRATDLNKKKAVMIVEIKFTDSVSGKLLRETVSVINGEYFRLKSNTPEEFTKLAKEWIKQALKYTEKT